METETKKLVRKRKFAELCDVSESTVDNWMAQGKVTVYRTPGRAPRFDPDEAVRVESPA